MGKRILLHTAFWLLYFAVILYNDLFLSPSFLSDPSWSWLAKSAASQFLLLLIKMGAVYYTLYVLLPRWLRPGPYLRPVLQSLVFILVALTLYRLMVQVVIWRYIYNSEAALTNLSFIARLFHSLLDLLQIVGIAATIKLFRLRLAAMKKEKALVQEKLSSEILHLKSQVNPHFLFNSLNGVFALSRAQSEKTPDMVMKLSNILRYMLYESEKELSTLSEEVQIIRDYIGLQQLRFGDRVVVHTDISIEEQSARITPLIILPLVENAFKHGVGGIAGTTEIGIRIHFSGQQLQVTITNALAEAPDPGPEKTGIGLSNIRRQLELLYRDYTFITEKKDSRFIVELTVNTQSYAGAELYHH